MNTSPAHPASFRDPSGFVFQHNEKFYRQINREYAPDYDLLMSSGLYAELTAADLLIGHDEVDLALAPAPDAWRVILPQQIDCISYSYEWSFDQLKDAALVTLDIMTRAISHGMIVKDANTNNIQWHEGNPKLIDTLSFEAYDESTPWVAYRQFCGCFLYPLMIAHYLPIHPQKIITAYPEGIPGQDAAALLPAKARLSLGSWLYVYLQQAITPSGSPSATRKVSFNRAKMHNLITHLHSLVASLEVNKKGFSSWENYYAETILSREYLQAKENLFRQFIGDLSFSRSLDLGCNDGYFSKILAERKLPVIAVDEDNYCIQRLYTSTRANSVNTILPLCIDLGNPSPAQGLSLSERKSFPERARSPLVCALALIHHLVLARNIPFYRLAGQLADYCTEWLIIEFVPLDDGKAQLLIANKSTHHKPFDEASFEKEFAAHFTIDRKSPIFGSKRTLYLMKKR